MWLPLNTCPLSPWWCLHREGPPSPRFSSLNVQSWLGLMSLHAAYHPPPGEIFLVIVLFVFPERLGAGPSPCPLSGS